MGTNPEERLKRYISYGSEKLYYHSSNKSNASFHEAKVTCVKELIERDGSCTNCVTYIIDIVKNLPPPIPYTALYALALCIRKCPHKTVEEKNALCKAYTAVRQLVETDSESFLVFTRFLREIVKTQNVKNGFGSGWKNTVIKWYENKPPIPLLELMLDKWKVMGWSHRDIIKLCHLGRNPNPEKDVIYVFALHGYATACELYKDYNEVMPILERMNAARQLRMVNNVSALVNMITLRNISDISKIPVRFVRNPEVWRVLIPRMKLDDFVMNINRMAKISLFKKHEVLSEAVKRFHEEDISDLKHVHPLAIFLVKQQYKLCAVSKMRMRKLDNGLVNGEVENITPHIPDTLLSKDIIMGLNFIYGRSLELLEPTGHRYCIALDNTLNGRGRGMDGHYRYISSFKAALCVATSLLYPDGVGSKLVTFMPVIRADRIQSSIWTVSFRKDQPLSQAFDLLPKRGRRANVGRLINWARLKQYSFDVFVVLSDSQMIVNNAAMALQSYREQVVPDARLFTWSFTGKHRDMIQLIGNNMFHMIGMDKKSPYILEKFLKNEF